MTRDTIEDPGSGRKAVSERRASPPSEPAHILRDDEEAIAVATRLAAIFAVGASERDCDRLPPWDELDLFSQSGLWSMNVPKADGGPGVSYATVARVFAIIASGDASIAQIAQNHVSLIDVIRFDPDAARKRFLLGEALRGIRFGNALAERGGKTILDMQTRITGAGDGFMVTDKNSTPPVRSTRISCRSMRSPPSATSRCA